LAPCRRKTLSFSVLWPLPFPPDPVGTVRCEICSFHRLNKLPLLIFHRGGVLCLQLRVGLPFPPISFRWDLASGTNRFLCFQSNTSTMQSTLTFRIYCPSVASGRRRFFLTFFFLKDPCPLRRERLKFPLIGTGSGAPLYFRESLLLRFVGALRLPPPFPPFLPAPNLIRTFPLIPVKVVKAIRP